MSRNKKKFLSKKNIIVILLLINISFIAILTTAFALSRPANSKKVNYLGGIDADLVKNRKILKEALLNNSSSEVYKNIVSHFENEQVGIQHGVMHMFGELLYEKEGKRGMLVCGNDFGFGCFHGFFLSILPVEGPEVLPELDKLCIEKYGIKGLGCPHGIGHGLLEYLGEDKLVEALNMCATLTWQGKLHGCQDGVFMQYNVPLSLSAKDSQIREFNDKNPYYPCNSEVPERFRQACYFSLGQWWESIFLDDFKKIGEFCGEISNDDERRVCFRGIGNVIPAPSYKVEEALSKCSLMPTEEGKNYCQVGAAWAFFANPQYRHLVSKICDPLPSSLEYLCSDAN